MEKIQVSRIIQNAFLLPLSRIGYFSKSLVFPILLMVAIWSLWHAISPEASLVNFSFYFSYIIAFVYFAIICHRLILVDMHQETLIPKASIYTIGRFTGLFIFVYFLSMLVEMAIITIVINILDNDVPATLSSDIASKDSEIVNKNIEIAEYVAYLPAMYIVGRFSLVFPATALGYKTGLKWSWEATKKNGLHVLFIIALFPWALNILLSLIYRENATFIEQTLLMFFMHISAAIGIFALSLTYRELRSIAEKKL